MKKLLVVPLLLLLVACEAMFSAEDESAIRQTIIEAQESGQLSDVKAAALLETLDQVQSGGFSIEAILASVLGIAGTFFGVTARRGVAVTNAALAARGDPKPLDAGDVAALKAIIAEKKAATPAVP